MQANIERQVANAGLAPALTGRRPATAARPACGSPKGALLVARWVSVTKSLLQTPSIPWPVFVGISTFRTHRIPIVGPFVLVSMLDVSQTALIFASCCRHAMGNFIPTALCSHPTQIRWLSVPILYPCLHFPPSSRLSRPPAPISAPDCDFSKRKHLVCFLGVKFDWNMYV